MIRFFKFFLFHFFLQKLPFALAFLPDFCHTFLRFLKQSCDSQTILSEGTNGK